MGKIAKAQAIALLAFVALGFGYLKAPYVGLKTEIESGRLSFQGLPIEPFRPSAFDVPTVTMQLGSLRFGFPKGEAAMRATTNGRLSNERMNCLTCGGVTLFVAEPRDSGLPSYQQICDPSDLLSASPRDSVDLIAGAYAADARRCGLWNDRATTTDLRQLLTVRNSLPSAERAEVLRGPGIKGIVSFDTIEDGRTLILFQYYSDDENLSDMAMLTVDPASSRGLNLARAILGSFRFSPDGVADAG